MALLASFVALASGGAAQAAVTVVVGPTPIPAGDATTAGDITVVNEKLAFALAIRSAVPYGVPRGAIVDVAPVHDGTIGQDRVVYADFIPDNWSAWPNSYQHVDVIERGPAQAVIRIERDWGKVVIATLYTLKAQSDHIQIQTTMRNQGRVALSNLLSGLTLWPKGGFIFPVPGLAGLEKGSAAAALTDRVVAYDENWSVTLHAPYVDHIAHGSLDMYRLHSLAPGQSRTFDGWLQVGANADLGPVIRAEIERKHLPSGLVRGSVRARDGRMVSQPFIVIEKQGKPYAWVLGSEGKYELTLAPGDYSLYATAKDFSQSPATPLRVRAGGRDTRDFIDLAPPGRVRFAVADSLTGKPLDARIVITEGQKPLVGFLGRKTFFTDLVRKGHAQVQIAPGDYVFTVAWGAGFLARSRQVRLSLAPGETRQAKVLLTPLFDPTARGWYSADLHHHADQAEAVTPAADLARSELAAGLDLLFVSDHDSTVNLAPLQRIAARRGVAFIPGVELSPSWGHFNAWPLVPGQRLAIDTSTATIDEIFREARRQGAMVVQVNHPFIPYGYFASLQAGVAPGGFNPAFDLVEMNAVESGDDTKVWHKMWEFWNARQHYYLAGGTDTHDVWNEESGRTRTFAHLDGRVSAHAFANALRAGHGYVSYGPLIFPAVMPGSTLRLKAGASFGLGFDLQSVAGLAEAELIGGGTVAGIQTFPSSPQQAHVDFKLTVGKPLWYALSVEDGQGRKAYTDPVWIDSFR